MYSIGTRRKKDTGSYCKLRNHETGDLLGKKYIKIQTVHRIHKTVDSIVQYRYSISAIGDLQNLL